MELGCFDVQVQTISSGLWTLSAAAEGGDLSCWQPSNPSPVLRDLQVAPGIVQLTCSFSCLCVCFTGGTVGVLAGVTPLTGTGNL